MRTKLYFVITLLAFLALAALPNSFAQLEVPLADVPFDIVNIPEPTPPPAAVRDFFELDPYYQQWINVRGFPVLASAEVRPYTVKEVAWTIGQMVGHRPDILRAMAQNRARFSIVPHNKHLPSELDNAGFNILRSEIKNGEFKVVNPQLIQGTGTTSERQTYTWTDTTAKPNVVYYYRIEDISHAGVREQLATVRMRGYVSAAGKLTTKWGDLKILE